MRACTWYIYTYSLLCLAPGCSQAEITLAGSLVKLQLEAFRQRKLQLRMLQVQTVCFKSFFLQNKIFISLEICDKIIPYMKKRIRSLVEEMLLECNLVSDAAQKCFAPWLFTHLFTEDESFTP